jgi:hypothetical protein
MYTSLPVKSARRAKAFMAGTELPAQMGHIRITRRAAAISFQGSPASGVFMRRSA